MQPLLLGDLVLVFWDIICICVGEMTVLVADAGKLGTASINNLKAVFRLPINFRGNLDVYRSIEPMASRNKYLRWMHVTPDLVGGRYLAR